MAPIVLPRNNLYWHTISWYPASNIYSPNTPCCITIINDTTSTHHPTLAHHTMTHHTHISTSITLVPPHPNSPRPTLPQPIPTILFFPFPIFPYHTLNSHQQQQSSHDSHPHSGACCSVEDYQWHVYVIMLLATSKHWSNCVISFTNTRLPLHPHNSHNHVSYHRTSGIHI